MVYDAFKAHHLALLISLKQKTGLSFFEIFEACESNEEYRRGRIMIGVQMGLDFGVSQPEVIVMFKRHTSEMLESTLVEFKRIAEEMKM